MSTKTVILPSGILLGDLHQQALAIALVGQKTWDAFVRFLTKAHRASSCRKPPLELRAVGPYCFLTSTEEALLHREICLYFGGRPGLALAEAVILLKAGHLLVSTITTRDKTPCLTRK